MGLSPDEGIARYRQELRQALSPGPQSVAAYAEIQHSLLTRYASRSVASVASLDDGVRGAPARQHVFLDLHYACVEVVHELKLSRPLWEYRDLYEQSLRSLLKALPALPLSLAELQTQGLAVDREGCLPRPGIETLLAVGLSSWYWLGAGLELSSAPLFADALPDDAERLRDFRRAVDPDWDFPATAEELRDYLEEEYVVDTWGDLALIRPDLIEPLTGKAPELALRELIEVDFARRQFPGVERLLFAELEAERAAVAS